MLFYKLKVSTDLNRILEGGGEQIERNSSQLEVLFITQMDAKVLGNLVITVWLVQLALLFNKIGCYLVTPIHYKNLCFCL